MENEKFPEFVSYQKIEKFDRLGMAITQKMHGTNAQIYINGDEIHAANRTRWLTLENDNHGFMQFVVDNKQELIQKLGDGRHFGEWCGGKIGSGEGIKEKRLYLFDWRKFNNGDLPSGVEHVPVLYTGTFNMQRIQEIFDDLRNNGSRAVPGFMRPEGIMIEINDVLYKKVFKKEESNWKKSSSPPIRPLDFSAVDYLLQPIRLEKLLVSDERLIREFPTTLPEICSAYFKDLVDENQFVYTDEENMLAQRKTLGKVIFYFVKGEVARLYNI